MTRRWTLFKTSCVVLALCLSLVCDQASRAGQWNRTPDLTIGWTAWSDAEIVSKMAVLILSRGMKLDVELTLADISMQYRGIAEGDLDVMLMSWQPKTHAAYLRRYQDRIEDLGVLYEDTSLGLVVPAYLPKSKLGPIADLGKPEVRDWFQGKIQGIGASAGIMGLTEKALKAYGVNYELLVSSGPAMARSLGQAIASKSPLIVTGWRPHWMFSEYALRYLDDPKGVFKSKEAVHIVARKGFAAEHPKLAAFFRRMHFQLEELEDLMVQARKTSHTEAILKWITNNRDRVHSWMHGK